MSVTAAWAIRVHRSADAGSAGSASIRLPADTASVCLRRPFSAAVYGLPAAPKRSISHWSTPSATPPMNLQRFPRYPLTFGPTPTQPLKRLSAHLGGEVGPEYGLPSDGTLQAIRQCARLEGMLTDPVYEGKSMHG